MWFAPKQPDSKLKLSSTNFVVAKVPRWISDIFQLLMKKKCLTRKWTKSQISDLFYEQNLKIGNCKLRNQFLNFYKFLTPEISNLKWLGIYGVPIGSWIHSVYGKHKHHCQKSILHLPHPSKKLVSRAAKHQNFDKGKINHLCRTWPSRRLAHTTSQFDIGFQSLKSWFSRAPNWPSSQSP